MLARHVMRHEQEALTEQPGRRRVWCRGCRRELFDRDSRTRGWGEECDPDYRTRLDRRDVDQDCDSWSSMFFRYDPDEWQPEIPGAPRHTHSLDTGKLTPGTLVVWERRPYRVVEVREREQANWPEKYRQAWVEQNMPDPATWYCRPRVIELRSEEDPTAKPQNLLGPNDYSWHTLPEHYPICRMCKEIPPCRHVHNERIMQRATEKLEKEMAILPGVCHGCREPISKRQKHFTFPGPNLIRPDLGDDTAVFHTRSDCYGSLTSYDERWAAAEPSRSQFFRCTGTKTVHHDGSSECSNPGCVAKGAHKDLVRHDGWVRHHPRLESARGCWCLASQLF